jgi:dihydrofolate synthase/folylpolyglutamate synthase
LQAAGYRVGLYTSPHLQDYAERIRVNGESIPHADLIELVNQIRPFLERGTKLTTFEITTGLAFLYFAHRGVNAMVAEVGLGGRLDATNVVMPVVSVITSISYDHTQILGNTLSAIAREKCGIIKPNVPVVSSPQNEEARLVIERIAEERFSPFTLVGRDILYAPIAHSLQNQTLLVWSSADQTLIDEYIESGGLHEWEPVRLTIPLLGYHQVENATTAYTALQAARGQGLLLDDLAIQRGFEHVNWPGRFEVLQRNPPVVIDSAHNRDSALKLRLTLDDYFPALPVVMIFGVSEDKDVEGMFAELLPRVRQVIATRSFHPRAMEPEFLVELAHHFGCPARCVEKVEDALVEALRLAAGTALILATGSIFIAAATRDCWYNQ